MKKKNSKCDYTESRNSNLRKAFFERLGKNNRRIDDLFIQLSQISAPRFYISEERALLLIKKKLKSGEQFQLQIPTRRDMIMEIERRVEKMMRLDSRISLKDAVFDVVNSPAPVYYLTPRSIRTIVYGSLGEFQMKERG